MGNQKKKDQATAARVEEAAADVEETGEVLDDAMKAYAAQFGPETQKSLRAMRRGPDSHYIHSLPPNKKLFWVTEEAYKEPRFHDWLVYTRAYYEADRENHGTQIGRAHRIDGDRVCVGDTFLVFQPLHIHAARKAAAELQERRIIQAAAMPNEAGDARVRLVQGTQSGSEIILNG